MKKIAICLINRDEEEVTEVKVLHVLGQNMRLNFAKCRSLWEAFENDNPYDAKYDDPLFAARAWYKDHGFSETVKNVLMRNKINTIDKAAALERSDLLKLRGVGPTIADQILKEIDAYLNRD